MIILSIETSADETAVSLVEVTGDFPHARYRILGNGLYSQVKVHEEYGGIFPAMAKREHAKSLTPLLRLALQEAALSAEPATTLSNEQEDTLRTLLSREPDLTEAIIPFFNTTGRPPIDYIAVTSGPGLEPTLWVGVNFAKALAYIWNIPVIPVNHMEGHVLASVFDGEQLPDLQFPALALLISGGHTEFDLMHSWQQYEKIGETRDDAVGEAFDKVARMLGLPYPGGPQIGKLAAEARAAVLPEFAPLPKPMLATPGLEFSFSGLKTAVRYAIEGKTLSDDDKRAIARDFEDTVTDVLRVKAARALDQTGAKALIIGGGVSASTHIRTVFADFFGREYPDVTFYVPERKLSTDNGIMIALSGHARLASARSPEAATDIKADGNRSLALD